MDRPFVERYSNVLDKQYFNFAAAHFLIFADGEREPLHGHNYKAELEIEGAGLDTAALVADFIEVKPLFKQSCNKLDHKVLLPADNAELDVSLDGSSVVARYDDDEEFRFPAKDVLVLPIENTSSELLARWLCEDVLQALSIQLPALELRRIAVHLSESPGQAARYERFWSSQPASLAL